MKMPANARANRELGGKHVLVWNQIDLIDQRDTEDKNAITVQTMPEGKSNSLFL